MSGDRPDTTQLYLLRHADAGDPEDWTGDDAERPLSPKGEAQAERLATFLHGTRFRVDALISSPKVRALRTAEIVADGLGAAGPDRRAARRRVRADDGGRDPGRRRVPRNGPSSSGTTRTSATWSRR